MFILSKHTKIDNIFNSLGGRMQREGHVFATTAKLHPVCIIVATLQTVN